MKINKLTPALAAVSLAVVSQSAFADVVGFRAGAGVWDHDVAGSIRYISPTTIDLKEDLKLKDESESYAFVAIEHPIPFLPNVKVSKTALSTQGNGTLTSAFSYGGITYSVSDTISTEMVLDHQDFTFYYEVLDNIVSLDLGLTAKAIDGSVSITRGGVTSTNELKGTIPMLYAAAAIDIPITGLSVQAEGNVLGVGDSKITDYSAKVIYESDFMIGVEGGVRSLTIELDDFDNSFADMEFSGPFVNVFLFF